MKRLIAISLLCSLCLPLSTLADDAVPTRSGALDLSLTREILLDAQSVPMQANRPAKPVDNVGSYPPDGHRQSATHSDQGLVAPAKRTDLPYGAGYAARHGAGARGTGRRGR